MFEHTRFRDDQSSARHSNLPEFYFLVIQISGVTKHDGSNETFKLN